MKKIGIFLSMISLFILLIGCNTDEPTKTLKETKSKQNIETIITHANYIKYDEEELFNDTELIVIAKTDENFIDREHVVKYVSSTPEEADLLPAIEDFYTKTPITIIEVLKQPKSSAIAKKDNMTIIEPVSLLENKDNFKRLSMEHYLEMDEGNNYILYLKKNTYGEYGVINMSNGKFDLGTIDKIKETSQENNDQKEREKMKNDVKKRFEKEIKKINNQT